MGVSIIMTFFVCLIYCYGNSPAPAIAIQKLIEPPMCARFLVRYGTFYFFLSEKVKKLYIHTDFFSYFVNWCWCCHPARIWFMIYDYWWKKKTKNKLNLSIECRFCVCKFNHPPFPPQSLLFFFSHKIKTVGWHSPNQPKLSGFEKKLAPNLIEYCYNSTIEC